MRENGGRESSNLPEDALQEANRRLAECRDLMVRQEKLATIGQVAAGIAHEINNPLGFLRSNHATLGNYIRSIEAFLREALAAQSPSVAGAAERHNIPAILADLSQLVSDCDDGFQRISEIIQSLRSFSHRDADTHTAFDLESGITSALIVAHNEVKYVADVTVSAGNLPRVECAPGEIMQVLLNLIINAAQAIKSQGRRAKGRIQIRAGVQVGNVWVEIEDDGPGIPADIQPRIFESFYTTKPASEGTGLGLSISWDIITRRHGGTLSVRSAPGQGACFRIELPVRGRPGGP